MSIKKNIGKNTIGDNQKMTVDLHTYNMSTHDLSTIFRNTQSPGTLVPNLVLLAQKGDTIDIDLERIISCCNVAELTFHGGILFKEYNHKYELGRRYDN